MSNQFPLSSIAASGIFTKKDEINILTPASLIHTSRHSPLPPAMVGAMENGTEIPFVTVKIEPADSDSDNETLVKYASRIKQEPTEQPLSSEYSVKLEPSIKAETDYEPDIGDYLTTQIDEERTDAQTEGRPDEGATCDMCGGTFRNKQGLSAHKKRIHLNKAMERSQRDGECSICHKKYVNRKSLMKHLNKMHLLNNGVGHEFRCVDCDKVFRLRNTLWMHRYHKHSNLDLRRACQHCPRVLKTPRSLRDHLRKKHPREYLSESEKGPVEEDEAILRVRPYSCELCERRYTSHSVLKKHITSVHPSPEDARSCPICRRAFKSEMRLLNHLEAAHSNTEDLRKCVPCDRVYKNKFSLQQHMKHQHGVRQPLALARECTEEEARGYTRRPHAVPSSGSGAELVQPVLDAQLDDAPEFILP